MQIPSWLQQEIVISEAMKKKLIGVAVVGVIFFCCWVYLNLGDGQSRPVSISEPLKTPIAEPKKNPPGKISSGEPDLITRNPFSLPPEYRQDGQPAATNSPQPPVNSTGAMKQPDFSRQDTVTTWRPTTGSTAMKLTGIAESDGLRLAVINTGGESKAYRVNEQVGQYRLIAIGADYVVLQSAGARKILQLEDIRENGGAANGR
ncbi:MAG: hypothetical protein E6713_01665 [Sporomusaceae bacterium]|nr:hypothetical protein [Sporomusaceae bacterium]